jgi:Ca-activated chloride channel family protein
MAAVTPTEQAPSPTAGRSRIGLPRPDSASAPPGSEPLADATGGRPAATTDAGSTADQASRRPDTPRVTVERLPLVGDRPTVVHTGGVAGTIRGRVTDKQDRPLAYVNIVVVGTGWGAFSKDDGSYAILNVLPGTYSVLTSRIGYGGQSVDSVVIVAGGTATVNFALEVKPTTDLCEVEIVAPRERMKLKSSRTNRLDPPSGSQGLPVSDITDLVGLQAGVVKGSTVLHIRGGRSGEGRLLVDGVPVTNHQVELQVKGEPTGVPQAGSGGHGAPSGSLGTAVRGGGPGPSAPSAGFGAPAPDGTPRVPTTGGTTLPNDEVYDSMFFEHYGVNPFIATDEDPLSTFAVDVDAASYTVMRRYVDGGHLPDKDAVRIEEFVNYFKQDYPQFNDTDFRIMIDGAPSPFGKGYQLLRVGIKARDIAAADRRPANLVFVIDVSGSMDREDRLELVKRSLRVLVDRLTPRDRVGIVVYGNVAHTILEPISLGLDSRDNARPDGFAERRTWKAPPREDEAPGAARERILAAIESLHPEGATNAEAGLLLGYEMARGIFRDGFINRIILCSDGVANIGQTGPESILERVRGEASRGIQITTIGFGMGNYNDVLMEQLADRGDGNYYYVDEIGEANRVLAENLTGTLQTVARDAKIQVEFDPCCVQRYRLIGFENRDVADRDFRNDKVDAGEIGAGHEVTALYEVKLVEGKDRGRIVTVRFRYLPPDRKSEFEPKAREMEQTFDSSELQRSFYDAPARFRLDAAVAEFAEVLRHSFWAKESRVADVLPVARSAAQDLPDDGAVREFVRLVESAVGLAETLSPEEQRRIQGR